MDHAVVIHFQGNQPIEVLKEGIGRIPTVHVAEFQLPHMAEVGYGRQNRKVAQPEAVKAQAVHLIVVSPGYVGGVLAPAAFNQPCGLISVLGVVIHGIRQRDFIGGGIDPGLQARQQRPSLAFAFAQDIKRFKPPLNQSVQVFNDLLIFKIGVDHAHTALQSPGMLTGCHPAQGVAYLAIRQGNRRYETRFDRLHAQCPGRLLTGIGRQLCQGRIESRNVRACSKAHGIALKIAQGLEHGSRDRHRATRLKQINMAARPVTFIAPRCFDQHSGRGCQYTTPILCHST